MVKVWNEGYLSLGGIGGQGIEGESHYIYTTYNTYEEMLSFGPKTAKEQKAFEEFIKNTDAISDFKGTYSVIKCSNMELIKLKTMKKIILLLSISILSFTQFNAQKSYWACMGVTVDN